MAAIHRKFYSHAAYVIKSSPSDHSNVIDNWSTMCHNLSVLFTYPLSIIAVCRLPVYNLDYSPRSEREIWPFLKANKVAITPKPERPHPSKLVCMHFRSTSTCFKFLSQLYFLTPMDYSPWSERKFWLFLKASKKESYLRNLKGHAHQNWFACISHQPLLA